MRSSKKPSEFISRIETMGNDPGNNRRHSVDTEDCLNLEESEHSGIFSSVSTLTHLTGSRNSLSKSTAPLNSSGRFSEESGLIISKQASLPHLPLGRRSNNLSEFTINKLNFAKLQLYGRDAQVLCLKASWEKAKGIGDKTFRELIAISGPSGAGKTRLAATLKEYSKKEGAGLFVRGKFSNMSGTTTVEPYSGIARACAEMVGAIVELQQTDADRAEMIIMAVTNEMGAELGLLAKAVPVLSEVFDIDDQETNASGSTLTADESSHQMKFAFLRFFRTIANNFAPLVVVLDDLQWANDASLDVLQGLILDDKTEKLLLVCLFRSDEVGQEHPLQKRLETFRKMASKNGGFTMQELQVDNLEIDDIQLLLQDVLSIDDQASKRELGNLARLCHEKTLGNAFYLLQYLASLNQCELLSFNFGTMRWQWDEKQIKLETNASENVVSLLQAQMSSLSTNCYEALKLAAILGSTFSYVCLKALWEEMMHLDKERLESSLVELELGGFLLSLVEGNSRSYSWAHDKLHEAAMSLVPENERASFANKAGAILVSNLDKKDIEASIFVTVNLLNAGAPQSCLGSLSPLDAARWNCTAVKRAVAISAFESAAEYARHGIRLLPETKWTDDYETALELYSLGAKAAGYLGNVEIMDRYCRAVLTQKVGKEEDKLRVYNVMVGSMVFQGRNDDAIALILDVLSRFNCNFPSNPMLVVGSILRNIFWIKSNAKRLSPANLDVMNDPVRSELMELLKRLNLCFYIKGDARYPLTGFMGMKWSRKYGLCGASSIGFAQAGVIIVAVLGDYQLAARLADYASDIVSLTKSDQFKSCVLMCSNLGVYCWSKPLVTLLNPLVESYNLGLRFGDTESATAGILHYIIFKYMSGGHLSIIAEELHMYMRQMKEVESLMTFKLSRPLLQAFLNLLGTNNSESSTILLGDALPEEGHVEAEQEPILWAAIITFGGILKTLFGAHVSAADDMVKHGPDCVTKIFIASATGTLDTFLKGVSCFAAARETGSKKYVKVAKKLRMKIKKWSKAGNPNVKNYESLLDAELMALQGKNEKAIKLYEDTIISMARSGCQQDTALACERLGEFYLKQMKNREDAKYRMTQARRYWLDWGAMAKVAHLDAKYPLLLDPSSPQL